MWFRGDLTSVIREQSFLVSSGFIWFCEFQNWFLSRESRALFIWSSVLRIQDSRVLIAQVRSKKQISSSVLFSSDGVFSISVVWRLFLHVYIIQISTNSPLRGRKTSKNGKIEMNLNIPSSIRIRVFRHLEHVKIYTREYGIDPFTKLNCCFICQMNLPYRNFSAGNDLTCWNG